jgi:hypothetical protein
MSIRMEIALAVAIVLGTAAAAPAAPKHRKPAVYRRATRFGHTSAHRPVCRPEQSGSHRRW